MQREFDRGYDRQPYRSLVADYPDESAYPIDSFRVEWGPVFHRGRLDGTARVLVLGQDPAAHEAIARRILVGEAGQRVQGLLTRLGIDRSYVFINTYLYSVFGQRRGERHIDDAAITDYRNRWLNAIVARCSCLVSPVRIAQVSRANIQSGRPGGRSRRGIGVRSSLVIAVP